MATSTYLANPVVTVNAVDLTDQCTAATFTYRFDQLENTTFGKTNRSFQAGLSNCEVTAVCFSKSGIFKLVETVRKSCCGALIGQIHRVNSNYWVC